jgi:hypothetical protein
MSLLLKEFYLRAKKRSRDIKIKSKMEMIITMKQSLTSIDQLISLKKYSLANEIIESLCSNIDKTYHKFTCAK